MAAEGLAATLAPAYISVLADKFGLVMRRVVNPETIRQVCVYRSLTRSLPPAADAFGEFLVDSLRVTVEPAAAPRRSRRRTGR
ncbi:hypothetical protein HQN59_19520 [Schlegelella sp. ID0723]|uniref:LysR substrate-binding domain-containing protein n=1 Tax=Piscinibacter koreensis TaxID=2742824 RepID=A0A7Y6NRE8_9BURK|nr:hypothetical protein [Schlegelella koreensis]